MTVIVGLFTAFLIFIPSSVSANTNENYANSESAATLTQQTESTFLLSITDDNISGSVNNNGMLTLNYENGQSEKMPVTATDKNGDEVF